MGRERTILLLGRLRQRATKFMMERLREEGYAPLAPAHGAIAALLRVRGPLAMSEIASLVEKRRPTVTSLVNRMVNEGVLEREADPTDARVVRVRLTERGVLFGEAFDRVAKAVSARVTRGVATKNQDAFMEVLGQLLDNLDEYK